MLKYTKKLVLGKTNWFWKCASHAYRFFSALLVGIIERIGMKLHCKIINTQTALRTKILSSHHTVATGPTI